MNELFITVLIFIGVIAVTVLIFGGWLIVSIGRAIGRAFGAPPSVPSAAALPPLPSNRVRCPRSACRAENPFDARFCRRCGSTLSAIERPSGQSRQVATLWD